ncbi:MAG: hypothetical protein V1921_04935 [Candidatus Altiarchaeota archaeon]
MMKRILKSGMSWFALLIVLTLLFSPLVFAAVPPYKETTPAESADFLTTGANLFLEKAFYFLVFIIRVNPCVVGETGGYCEYFESSSFFYFPLQEDTTVKNINGTLLKLFVPFFVTLLILLGLYLIFMQGSVRGRAQAKSMLLDVFIGLVLTSISPLIFQTLLNISGEIVDAMALSVDTELTSVFDIFKVPAGALIIGFCIWQFGLWFVQMAVLVAAIRYFVVVVCAALFPLGIFLWSFRLTKGMGNAIINFSIAVIFTQVFQMGFLAMGITFLSSGGSGIINAVLTLASFLGIVLTPLLVSKILPWIGGTVFAYSSRGGATFTRPIALMMQGSSFSSAIAAAGGRYQTTHTMGWSERGGERLGSALYYSRGLSGEEVVAYTEGGYYAGERSGWYSMTPGAGRMAFRATGDYEYNRPGCSFWSSRRHTAPGAGSPSVQRPGRDLNDVTPASVERAREPSKIIPSASAKEPGRHAPLDDVRKATEAVRGARVSRPAAGEGGVVSETGVPSKPVVPPETQMEGETAGEEAGRQKDLSSLWRDREREKFTEAEHERKEELSEAAGEAIPEGEMPPATSGARITESDYAVKGKPRRAGEGLGAEVPHAGPEAAIEAPSAVERPRRGAPAELGAWKAHVDERRLERLKPDEAERVKEVFGRVEEAGLSDRFKDKGAVVGDLVGKAEKAPQILEEGADGRSVADKMIRKAAEAENPEEELKGWEVAVCEECGMPFIKQKRGK